MKLSKGWIALIVIVGLIFILGTWMSGTYNGMVTKDEAVAKAWSQVENVYQRRADLIPNLVKTVEGAANFEKSTLKEVMAARASATSVKIDPTHLNESNIAAFQKAQDGLSSALSRLMVVVERYPELKANQNFLELQAQLEGTENRISVERGKFNDEVNGYNNVIRHFPGNIMAVMFSFEKKGYFQAQAGAEKAPGVSFDFGK
ncbi:LemA family protein [Parabacteroides sp. FAFU027]|uniref:LemA family protein n=1 Tax=Parabacteroides sp. FAFU027 TaxID=2922715 RepID=UPI001FAF2B37|nr:LemA family protein [Parabacteroides sp. FAFU027]